MDKYTWVASASTGDWWWHGVQITAIQICFSFEVIGGNEG